MIEFNSAFPLFVTDQLNVQKDFYTNTFGFNAVFFDENFYLHLQHPENGTELGFLKPNHSSQPDFLHASASADGIVISFEVSSADKAFAQANALHLEFALPLTMEEWGQHHFIIRDPAGFMVDVIENVSSV